MAEGTEGGSYRYGFNGKETDPETDIQDYGMRWYLPNICRFPSVDPLTPKYPWYIPYQFAGNTPIMAIDLDGLEVFIPASIPIETILTLLRIPTISIPRLPINLEPAPILVPIPEEGVIISHPDVRTATTNIEIDWANNAPASPADLGDEWEEVTHPDNKSGSQDFKNKGTGDKIRFDKGKQGKQGWEGKDHWHRHNPNSQNKRDFYLDKDGNPVPKGSDASHIKATTTILLPEIIIIPPSRTLWQKFKDFLNQNLSPILVKNLSNRNTHNLYEHKFIKSVRVT